MAQNDFLPFNSTDGGHGGVHFHPLNAGESFLVGEPVRLNADGELVQATDPVDDGIDVLGIAATSGDTTGTAGGANPVLAAGSYPGNAGDADGLPNTGDRVGVFYGLPGVRFITSRFSSGGTGAGAALVPTQAHIGDECGFVLDAGGTQWFLDINTTSPMCRVVDVLDVDKRPIAETGNAGVWVVFVFTSSQSTVAGDAAA